MMIDRGSIDDFTYKEGLCRVYFSHCVWGERLQAAVFYLGQLYTRG